MTNRELRIASRGRFSVFREGVKQLSPNMENQYTIMEDNHFETTAWITAGMIGFLSGNITGFLLGALFVP